jgi:nucleotide-binding universal stress UspA family protein
MTGSPEKAIPRQAQREGADLVIIGKHRDGSTRRKVLGSVAENIVHRARCSVLVIPAKEKGTIGYETD